MEAQACYSLGNTYTLLRDLPASIEYHMRHMRIAQELSDTVGEGESRGGERGRGGDARGMEGRWKSWGEEARRKGKRVRTVEKLLQITA